MIGRNDECFCKSGEKYKKCCKNDKIFIFVGNGLAYNCLGDKSKVLNPSKPIKKFDCHDIEYDFLQYMSKLELKFKGYNHEEYESEFDIIKDIIDNHNIGSDIECYIRRFLATAYSYFQVEFDNIVDLTQWHWNEEIKLREKNIVGFFSLNYDVILEKILKKIKIDYYRVATTEDKLSSIKKPIFKPHGSIDFGLHNFICGNEECLWQITTSFNQKCDENGYYCNIIDEKDWLSPRGEMDLIPPYQENYYRELGWVKRNYDYLEKVIYDVNKFIIFGFSYAYVDRMEFNEVVSCIKRKETVFYNINRVDSSELKIFIEGKGFKYKFINVCN